MRCKEIKNLNCIIYRGLGGAGQRHLRIFSQLLPNIRSICSRVKGNTPLLNPDFTVSSESSLESVYGIEVYPNFEEAYSQNPDLTVIATPTSNHCNDIIYSAERGVDVFVEKPGAVNSKEARRIVDAVKANQIEFFISYQRRFHPMIETFNTIRSKEGMGKIVSLEINVNSYVPFWHPYENFRDLYACRKDLGGGVLKTEIHEIDLVNWLFGPPKKIQAEGGCYGSFDLDVEDTANLILEYDEFVAKINLCFMNKKQSREINIKYQHCTIEMDFIKNKLVMKNNKTNKVSNYDFAVENDLMFELQAKYFLQNFNNNNQDYINSIKQNSLFIDTCIRQINQ